MGERMDGERKGRYTENQVLLKPLEFYQTKSRLWTNFSI